MTGGVGFGKPQPRGRTDRQTEPPHTQRAARAGISGCAQGWVGWGGGGQRNGAGAGGCCEAAGAAAAGAAALSAASAEPASGGAGARRCLRSGAHHAAWAGRERKAEGETRRQTVQPGSAADKGRRRGREERARRGSRRAPGADGRSGGPGRDRRGGSRRVGRCRLGHRARAAARRGGGSPPAAEAEEEEETMSFRKTVTVL